MIEGPLFRKILLFAVPIVLTNLLQTFFNVADMMVVSLSPEVNAVGAIGTTNALISTMLTLFIGISGGVTVVVSQRIGARDDDATSRAVHTAVTMALPIGFLAMATTLLISRPILSWMGTAGDLLELAVKYTRIYAFGLPLATLFNFTFGVFSAKGDSRTPLLVMTSAGVLNVLLNLFFVLVLKMSVEGVAIATAISTGASAVALIFFLRHDTGVCRLSLKKLGIDIQSIKRILYNGIPNALQGSMFGVSNIMITSSVLEVNNAVMATLPAGTVYQPIITGNTVASSLQNFPSITAGSVAQATLPFAGQNAGAKKYRRLTRVWWEGCLLVSAFVGFVTILTLLLKDPLLALYGVRNIEGTPQAIAYETALLKLRFVGALYFIDGLMNVCASVLRGLGRSVTSATVVFFGVCVFRFVWIFTVFRHYRTLFSVYLSYPITWTVTTLVLAVFILFALRKKVKEKADESAE